MQASMHASELQGNAVMIELLEYFKKYQPKGDVYLIPQCNPIGKDVFIGAGHQVDLTQQQEITSIDITSILKLTIQHLLKNILIQLQQSISKLLKIFYNKN
ncbi:hypothetical protein X557_06480 [Francisella tularensis subsp. holarctica PHIT-FT049]|nr:hypothetical protein X557_06480 [Francisella tularensis subsp. holarctica PHIT-FT049]